MRILESVLYAEDLAAAHQFYTEVLDLDVISFNPERHLFMQSGESVLIVFRASKTLVPDAGVPAHGTTGPGHLAFAASSAEIDEWQGRLEKSGIKTFERTWDNGARSLYFDDPAGNVLEFVMPSLWNMS